MNLINTTPEVSYNTDLYALSLSSLSLSPYTIINPTTELEGINKLIDVEDIAELTLIYEGVDESIKGKIIKLNDIVVGSYVESYYTSTNIPLDRIDESIANIIVDLPQDEVIFVSTPTVEETRLRVESYLSKVDDYHNVQYGSRVPEDTTILIDTVRTWRLCKTEYGGSSINITYRTSSEAEAVIRRVGMKEVYRMCTPLKFNSLPSRYPTLVTINDKLGPKLKKVIDGYYGSSSLILGVLLILERCKDIILEASGTIEDRLLHRKNTLSKFIGRDSISTYVNLLIEAYKNRKDLLNWCNAHYIEYSIMYSIIFDVGDFDIEDLSLDFQQLFSRVFPVASRTKDGFYVGDDNVKMSIIEDLIPSAITAINPEVILVIHCNENDKYINLAISLDEDTYIETEQDRINFIPNMKKFDLIDSDEY